MTSGSDRFPRTLLAIYVVWWAALAIAPRYRQDWLLENLLVFVAVPALVLAYRRLRLSNYAYGCLFAFFTLHAIGAHYTYSEVPYDAWAEWLTGSTISAWFGFERNHYDRLVHFAYGFLMLPAVVELFDAVSPPKGGWRYLMPVLFLNAHSVIYELIEWGAAEVFGGDLGEAYLGTQGDTWDAQKDMGLAFLGAVLAMAIVALRRPRGSSRASRS